MIRVDYRIGSAELERLFLPYGIKVVKEKLDFGDFDWIGNGPKGQCAVVVERKRIEDLVQSMQSKRLSGHQLPGIAENYDYGYLVIEGIWKPGVDGDLEILTGDRWQSRHIHTRAITNYVMGLTLRAGMMCWRTASPQETVSYIVDQYRMWTEKRWDEHQAHDQVYAPAEAGQGMRISLLPRKIGYAEKVAMQLPGLDGKAKFAARHFKTVRAMGAADEQEWAGVPWKTKTGQQRKLGAVVAKKIFEAIQEEKP